MSSGDWRGQPTEKIVESLRPGEKEAPRTWTDGLMMNGNTRTMVLEERGTPINILPREVKIVDEMTLEEHWEVWNGRP